MKIDGMIDWKAQLVQIKKSNLNQYVLASEMIADAKAVKLGKHKGNREENASHFLSRKNFRA
jgi:hypothetical protein